MIIFAMFQPINSTIEVFVKMNTEDYVAEQASSYYEECAYSKLSCLSEDAYLTLRLVDFTTSRDGGEIYKPWSRKDAQSLQHGQQRRSQLQDVYEGIYKDCV